MNKIPKDKLLHFFWGGISAFPLIYIFSIYGFIFSLTLYAAKEIVYDWYMNKGNPEFMDFVYSSVPAVFYLTLKLNL
jgi:hypothetical protein|tara:strand:+ start:596 stop:826 length:231 start_codon:yes stop_codon:yes gene_type:complete